MKMVKANDPLFYYEGRNTDIITVYLPFFLYLLDIYFSSLGMCLCYNYSSDEARSAVLSCFYCPGECVHYALRLSGDKPKEHFHNHLCVLTLRCNSSSVPGENALCQRSVALTNQINNHFAWNISLLITLPVREIMKCALETQRFKYSCEYKLHELVPLSGQNLFM